MELPASVKLSGINWGQIQMVVPIAATAWDIAQKAKDEADRARYLEQLGKREEAAWNQISAHIQKRQPNEYDKAVSLLVDLHDLAVRKQQVPEFQAALEKLREKHAAKESFLRRLSKAKL